MSETISGVPTAITAFIGGANQGPYHTPVEILSVAAFEQHFGAVASAPTLGPAVRQFFDNGGTTAVVVRVPSEQQIADPSLEARQRGLWALDKQAHVNMVCILPFATAADGDISARTRMAAASYCMRRRALFIVDPLATWRSAADVVSGTTGIHSAVWGLERTSSAALYFPRLLMADPVTGGQLAEFAPCGAVAGVIARIDAQQGVWKSPAGVHATLAGVSALSLRLTDAASGRLNALAVNGLREVPNVGAVVWGARIWSGTEGEPAEWKYVSVRRLASFIEHSIERGTQWAGSQPNDESLWTRLRAAVGRFMSGLFTRGAFAGRRPQEAWYVKCGRGETMTQTDIDNGVLIIEVGVAPVRPAEFVVIRIGHTFGRDE